MWRRGDETIVETILEYVQWMAKTLMSIDAALKDIEELLEEADGDDA